MARPVEINYAIPEPPRESRIWKWLLVVLLIWGVFRSYEFFYPNVRNGIVPSLMFIKQFRVQSSRLWVISGIFGILSNIVLLVVLIFSIHGWRIHQTSKWFKYSLIGYLVFEFACMYFNYWSSSFNWRAMDAKSQITNYWYVFRLGLYYLLLPAVALYLFPTRADYFRFTSRIKTSISVSVVLLAIAMTRDFWDLHFEFYRTYDNPKLLGMLYFLAIVRLLIDFLFILLSTFFLYRKQYRLAVLFVALLPLYRLLELVLKSIHWSEYHDPFSSIEYVEFIQIHFPELFYPAAIFMTLWVISAVISLEKLPNSSYDSKISSR